MVGRVVHLNAEINHSSVPLRLLNVMDGCGIHSDILTMKTTILSPRIQVIEKSFFTRLMRKLDTAIIALEQKKYPNWKKNMAFYHFHVGVDVSRHNLLKEADVVIFHWVGGTFLSYHGIKKVLKLGKRVILVCHDNGYFTGGCHVRMGCMKYETHCGMCPQLASEKMEDWSYQLYEKRIKLYQDREITVVSPSRWMDHNVATSKLLGNKEHVIIPNPIDTNVYCPGNLTDVREKYNVSSDRKIILFGATNVLSAPYKGYDKLLEALDYYSERYKDLGSIDAYVFGATGQTTKYNDLITIHYLGYLDEQAMVEAYQLADIYVVPSLEDSFNNTVAESMATGTPVASFATGGIPDIIDHKENGYLAEYGNAIDLAKGMAWLLEQENKDALKDKCRQKIIDCFSYSVVGEKWEALLEEVNR